MGCRIIQDHLLAARQRVTATNGHKDAVVFERSITVDRARPQRIGVLITTPAAVGVGILGLAEIDPERHLHTEQKEQDPGLQSGMWKALIQGY